MPKPEDFGFFGTSSGSGNIFLENLAKTRGGTKKTKILETSKPKTSETLVFLVPPQVLARFSPLDFGFFGTSSGSGEVFKENIVKT